MSQLEWPEFKRTYFPLRDSKIQAVFTQIMVSSKNKMVKQINFDTLSKWNMWNKLLFKEIETQQKLAQQYPEQVLQILHYGVQMEIKSVTIYIVYDCDQDAKPFLDYINSITFIGDEQKLQCTDQLLQISCLLQASGIQHRNIKPNNLVYFQGKVLLTDFGSARTHYLSYGKDYTALAEKKWQKEFWYYQCPEFIKILQEENLDFREQAWEEVNYNEYQRGQLYQRADLWSIGLIMITLFSSSFKYPLELNQFYGFNTKKLEGKLIELSDTTHMAIIESIKAILQGEMKTLDIYQLFNKLKKLNDKKVVSLSTINKEEENVKMTINKFQCSKKLDLAYDKNYYFINKQNIIELDKVQDLQRKSTLKRDKPSQNEIRIVEEDDEYNMLINLSDDNNPFQIQSNFQINNEEFKVTSPQMLKQFTDQQEKKQINSVQPIQTQYNVYNQQNANQLLIISQGYEQSKINSIYPNQITEQIQPQSTDQLQIINDQSKNSLIIQRDSSQIQHFNQSEILNQKSNMIQVDDLKQNQDQSRKSQGVNQFNLQQNSQQINLQQVNDSKEVNKKVRTSQVVQFDQQQQKNSNLISIDDFKQNQDQSRQSQVASQYNQQQNNQQINLQSIDDSKEANNKIRQQQVSQFDQQQIKKQNTLTSIEDSKNTNEQARQFQEANRFNQIQNTQQSQLIQIDDFKTDKKVTHSQTVTQFDQQGIKNQESNLISIEDFKNAQEKAKQSQKIPLLNQQNQGINMIAIDDFNQSESSNIKKQEFKIFSKEQYSQLTQMEQNQIQEQLIRYKAETTDSNLKELITQQLNQYEEFNNQEGFNIFQNAEMTELIQPNVGEQIALNPVQPQFQQQDKDQSNFINTFTQKSEIQPQSLLVVQFDEMDNNNQSQLQSGLLIVQQQVAENIVIRPEVEEQANKFINNQTVSNLVKPFELIDVKKQSLQKYGQELSKLKQTASNQDKMKIVQQLERINQINQSRTEIINEPLKKQELYNLNNVDLFNYKTTLMQIKTNDISVKDEIRNEIKNITNRMIAKDKLQNTQLINHEELKQLSIDEAEYMHTKFKTMSQTNSLTPQQQQILSELQDYINVQRKFETIIKNNNQPEILTQNELLQLRDEQLHQYQELLRDQLQQKFDLATQQQIINIQDRLDAIDELKQFKISLDSENLLSNQTVQLLSPSEQLFYEAQLQTFLTDPTLDKSIQEQIRKQLLIIQDSKQKQQQYQIQQQQQQQQQFQEISQHSYSNENNGVYNDGKSNLNKSNLKNIDLNPLSKLENKKLPKIGKEVEQFEQLRSKLNLFLQNPLEKYILSNEEIDKLTQQQLREYLEQLKSLIGNSSRPSQKLKNQLEYIKTILAPQNLNPKTEKAKSIDINTLPSDRFSPKNPTQNKCLSVEENQKLLDMEKDFQIWSTNIIVRRFQVWKITNEQLISFPQKYANLIKTTQLREKQEDKLKIYGGYWLDGKPSGLGILMRKDHGGIYEGVFDEGRFVYGMVLELNSQGKLQKYIGEYHREYQLKNGVCTIEWYDELRPQNFELKEWHEGTIVLNKFRGKGIRFYKDGRKYVGQWRNNLKEGQGEVYRRGSNNQYTKIFEGEFRGGVYNGNGTIIFDQNLKQIGMFRNGNPVGKHELFRGQILEKTIEY